MAPAGTVAQIWRHPVKSMQGEGLETGTLTEIGLEGDRRWGVIDAATDKVLSAKREPRLLEGRARLVNGGPEISLPDGAVVCFGDPGAEEHCPAGSPAASVWSEPFANGRRLTR